MRFPRKQKKQLRVRTRYKNAHGVLLLFCCQSRACHPDVRRRALDHVATDSVRSKLTPFDVPASPVDRMT